MNADQKKPHLSQSRLGMLARCGMQYYWRYVEGVIAPPGVAMLVGGATDAAVTKDLQTKIETGALLADDQVEDVAAEALKTRWLAEPPILDNGEREMGETKAKAEAIDRSVALALLHHQELAPDLRPKYVQRAWRIVVEGQPYDVVGYIDVQEQDGTIRDTKTKKTSPAKGLAHQDLQLTTYAAAKLVIDGALPEKLTLDFLISLKRGPKLMVQETVRNMDQVRAFLAWIERAILVIQSGAFMPCDPTSWMCSAKWCGYFDRCPFGRAQMTVIPTTGGE